MAEAVLKDAKVKDAQVETMNVLEYAISLVEKKQNKSEEKKLIMIGFLLY